MNISLISGLCCCLLALHLIPTGALADDELWSARLEIDGRDDVPVAVAVDSMGGVFVTGATSDSLTQDDLTVAYDASGGFRWISTDHSDSTCPGAIYTRALVMSATGDPIIGGNTTCKAQKAFVMDLSATSGAPAWVHRGPNPSFDDPFGALVSDQQGGAYLVTDFDLGPWLLEVHRFSPNGTIAWEELIHGPDSIHASAAAVAGDSTLYIAGTVEWWNIYVAALSSDGDELWGREFDFAPGKEDERSVACATDSAGNLAVLIQTTQWKLTGPDYEVLKLDPQGSVLWYEAYDAAGGADSAAGIACGVDGSVFVTGRSWGGPATGHDISTVKFGPLGGPPIWVTRVSGVGDGVDEGRSIVVDDAGYVYVAGSSYQGLSRGSDMLTLRYDPDGGEVWRAFYVGPAGDDSAMDLDVSSHRVVVAGRSQGAGNLGYDFVTIAYGVFPVAVEEVAIPSRETSMVVAPNPTTGPTRFHIDLPTEGRTSLRIYDIGGRLVRALLDSELPAGGHVVLWEGRDDRGAQIASGIYFYHLVCDHRTVSKHRIAVIR